MVFIYDKVSSYGARTLLLVSAILFSLSNGVGVFGVYFSGGVKSAFSAPYLFDYVIAIVENPVCRDRSTAILSIRSDQKTDGDIFFNRSLMALSGKATDTQEIIARWSTPNADILIARSTIAKAIAESENIRPNSRLLVLTKSDQIKESLLDVLSPDGVIFIDPENTTKDSLQQVCSSLDGSF